MKFYFYVLNDGPDKNVHETELSPFECALLRDIIRGDIERKRACGLEGVANDLQTLRNKIDYTVMNAAKMKPGKCGLQP